MCQGRDIVIDNWDSVDKKYRSKEWGSRRMYSLTPISQELRLLLGKLNPQLLDSLTQS